MQTSTFWTQLRQQISGGVLTGFVGLAGLALTGCAYGNTQQVLRAQVAAEASCPEIKVGRQLTFQEGYAPDQYRLSGCGLDRLYTCPPDDGLVNYGDLQCTFVDGRAAKPAAAVAAPDAMQEPMDDSSSEPPPADDSMGATSDDSLDSSASPADPAAPPAPAAPAAKSKFKASGKFKAGN